MSETLYDVSGQRLKQQEVIFSEPMPEVDPSSESLNASFIRVLVDKYIDERMANESEWNFADDPHAGEVIVQEDEARLEFMMSNFSGLDSIEAIVEMVEDYERQQAGETIYREEASAELVDGEIVVTTPDEPIPSDMDDLFLIMEELYPIYTQQLQELLGHFITDHDRYPINLDQSAAIWQNDPSKDKAIWHNAIFQPVVSYFRELFQAIDQNKENATVRTDYMIKAIGDAIAMGCPEIIYAAFKPEDLALPELSSVIPKLTAAKQLKDDALERLEIPQLIITNTQLIKA